MRHSTHSTIACLMMLMGLIACEKSAEHTLPPSQEPALAQDVVDTSADSPTEAVKPVGEEDIKTGAEPSDSGLVVVASSKSGQEAFEAIKSAIEGNEALTLMTTVDHAENAKGADMEIGFTRVLIFGNPKVGTPLMKASKTMALDLPQRMLIVERDGKTSVVYNDPMWLASRHGVQGEEERLKKVSELLEQLAAGAK